MKNFFALSILAFVVSAVPQGGERTYRWILFMTIFPVGTGLMPKVTATAGSRTSW
jgi:hypothetical protein